MNLPHYIVQDAAAKMPSTCKGVYRRVGLLLVDPGVNHVAMISEHARGCRVVVRTWERLHAKGKNTAYSRALAEAQAMADELNAALSQGV